MRNKFLYLILIVSFTISSENKWATTRFEHWYLHEFSSMKFHEPISFIPYKVKIGTFYYGANDFWNQILLHDNFNPPSPSPVETSNGIYFNYIDNLKYRSGIALKIDFLEYNFFKKLQNTVDIGFGFGYSYKQPLLKAPIIDWFSNSNKYYYNPIIQSFNFNTSFTFFLQETFAPYLSFSYGYVDADLFHNSNDSYIIKGQGHTTNINVGFNIIKPLKHKSYKLLYGLEVNFDDIVINKMQGIASNISKINKKELGLSFTIGIVYGGNRTVGDEAFKYLINSDYLNAIESFNRFKIKFPDHPKIKKANQMIEFSKTRIAYDMFYNGVENFYNSEIDSALFWYNKALIETKDENLKYQIESRKFIIADKLYKDADNKVKNLSLDESIDYLKYIATISDKIKSKIAIRVNDLLYKKADIFLNNNNYKSAHEIYISQIMSSEESEYIFKAKINTLVSLVIDKVNLELSNKDYIAAYESMKFLDNIYPNLNSYIDDNINIIKNELELNNISRINRISQNIINRVKGSFSPNNSDAVINYGDSYNEILDILGEPKEILDKVYNNMIYYMASYNFEDKIFKLYFEDNILFDIEEVK